MNYFEVFKQLYIFKLY